MNTCIISCKTIQREVEKAIQDTGCNYPVSWIESGLHNFPDKLRAKLQELLDTISADRVLLAMGFCGNSLAELKTRNFELIFPRADDCITLLLGSFEERKQYPGMYFLTQGWLEGERNIYEEYKYTVNKYGITQGKEIFKMMLNHYKYLGLLDTGVCNFDVLSEEASVIADELSLQLKKLQSSDLWLKGLLTGPWPENRYCTIPQNTVVQSSHLTVN